MTERIELGKLHGRELAPADRELLAKMTDTFEKTGGTLTEDIARLVGR